VARRSGERALHDILAAPLRAAGGFFAMALDVVVLVFKPPFAWREFVEQSWFVARVSIVPTLMLSIPLTVLTVFTLNILLVEFGDQVSCALAAAICCWKLPSLSAASLL
jgi:phospholipid/cholesterol/gamma-HCH transport system permease protein